MLAETGSFKWELFQRGVMTPYCEQLLKPKWIGSELLVNVTWQLSHFLKWDSGFCPKQTVSDRCRVIRHSVHCIIHASLEGTRRFSIHCKGTLYYSRDSPGHTLRCCTPAMVFSKRAAMPKNRMRCAAMESSTCSIFSIKFWNISAICYPIFKRVSAF